MLPTQSKETSPKIFWDVPLLLTRKASPALFAVTMGTGAISGLFASFPYAHNSSPMMILSLIVFLLNLSLFALFTTLVVVKYLYFPDKWSSLIRNPVTSLYSGCFPMAGTTLINVATEVVHARYNVGGKGFLYFIWAMWWLDIIISFICCWVGVHVMVTHQTHSLQAMNTMWLLPIVTLIVASSSGGVVAHALQQYSTVHALKTVVVSVFMVTVGLSLALMVLTIYLLRLIVHGLPPGATILSVFLPLGPTGQSGYAVLLIGQNFRTLFPAISDSARSVDSSTISAGTVVDLVCTCLSFILWSLATMWILYALLAMHSGLRKSAITFRISFWGLVFPNGVYANLTIQLSNVFDSRAFRVWGAIYAAATLILWLSILIRSIWELKTFLVLHEPPSNAIISEISGVQQQDLPHQSAETSVTELA